MWKKMIDNFPGLWKFARMDNSIITTIRQGTTEKVLVYTDISAADAEKLDIITKGSKVPKGILLANLVYLQSVKAQNAIHTTPTPAA